MLGRRRSCRCSTALLVFASLLACLLIALALVPKLLDRWLTFALRHPYGITLNFIIAAIIPHDAAAHHNTANLKWARVLRENVGTIRAEWQAFEDFVGGDGLRRFTHRNGFASPHWKNIFLFNVGTLNEMVAAHFPKTVALLFSMPVVSATFSILPSMTRIPPHIGQYKGLLRYHLTLFATNETVSWEEQWPWNTASGAQLRHLKADEGAGVVKPMFSKEIPAAHLGECQIQHGLGQAECKMHVLLPSSSLTQVDG